MSERLLHSFRETAELATAVPAFEPIEAAGQARRRRRHRRMAVGGAALACSLVVTGILAGAGGNRAAPPPANEPHTSATPYPGPEIVTLDAGTYDLTPYADVALPAARVKVPGGWSASYGPEKFEGIGAVGADNARALRRSPWYAGLLVTEVGWLAAPNCNPLNLMGAGVTQLLPHLTALPRVSVTHGPDPETRLGHPAFHLGLKEIRRGPDCAYETFHNARGPIGNLGLGGTYDIWLIDVDGEPLLVVAGWTRDAPRSAVEELLTMADSIELHPRQLPWRQ